MTQHVLDEKSKRPNHLILLMPESGLEPPTSSLRMSCSTELSYTGEKICPYNEGELV